MTWTTRQPQAGQNVEKFSAISGATIYTFTTWSNYAPQVGDLVVAHVAGNHAAGTTATAADDSAQPGTANVWTMIGPAQGSSTLSEWFAWCILTRPFLSGTTLTVTTSANGSRRFGMCAVVSATGIISFDASTIVNNDNTSPIAMASPALAGTNEIAFAGAAVRSSIGIVPTEGGSGFSLYATIAADSAGTAVSGGLSINTTAGAAAVTASQSFTAYTTGAGIIAVWKESAPPDAYVPLTTQGTRTPFYSPRLSKLQQVFGVAQPQAVEWSPLPSSSPQRPAYPGSYSAVSAAADEAILPSWAAVTRQRPVEFYRGGPSRFVATLDNTAPQNAIATIAQSAQRASHPSASSVIDAFAAPAAAPADSFAIVTQSIIRAARAKPGSFVAEPLASSNAAYASVLQNAVTRYYLGSHSAVSAAADELIAQDGSFAPVMLSLARAFYHGPGSYIVGAAEETAVAPEAFVPVMVSVARAFYRAPRSQVGTPQPIAAPGGFGPVTLSNDHPFYHGPGSYVIGVGFEPEPAAQVFASVYQGSQRERAPDESLVTLVVFAPVVTPDGYASVYQGRSVTPEALRSLVISPLGLTTEGAYAAVFQSRALDRPDARASLALLPAVAAPSPGYVPVVQSRGSLARVASHSIAMMPIGEGAVIVTPAPNTGGGGEWIIWTRPDFPANRRGAFPEFNRPQFRKPTRRVK